MKELLSLAQDGVEMIDYPEDIRQQVELAATAWREFTTLPVDTKQSFAATELQSGVGYEQKGNGERQSRDLKENFDITASSLKGLTAKAPTDHIARHFVTSAAALFAHLEPMITDYGQHVESTYSVPGFAAEAAASAPSAFVRFLSYPPVPEGTVIGEPHVDHSGFTFHLYESTDGCDRLAFDGTSWLPMPVEQGKAAAFASMQSQLFSNNTLTGLCHRITANKETAQLGRIAIVCFVPLVTQPAYDRATHGRLQEMAPGFNYHMAPEQFRALFRDR